MGVSLSGKRSQTDGATLLFLMLRCLFVWLVLSTFPSTRRRSTRALRNWPEKAGQNWHVPIAIAIAMPKAIEPQSEQLSFSIPPNFPWQHDNKEVIYFPCEHEIIVRRGSDSEKKRCKNIENSSKSQTKAKQSAKQKVKLTYFVQNKAQMQQWLLLVTQKDGIPTRRYS